MFALRAFKLMVKAYIFGFAALEFVRARAQRLVGRFERFFHVEFTKRVGELGQAYALATQPLRHVARSKTTRAQEKSGIRLRRIPRSG